MGIKRGKRLVKAGIANLLPPPPPRVQCRELPRLPRPKLLAEAGQKTPNLWRRQWAKEADWRGGRGEQCLPQDRGALIFSYLLGL